MAASPPPLEKAAIPAEIDRWNWGAFLLNWIWGVGNNTFIALLTLVPGLGLIMAFVLGVKGSGWAWRNGRWDSIEHFKRVQRLWAIWGVVIWLGLIVLFGGIFGGVFYALKSSDAYQLAVSRLQANTAAVSALGLPSRPEFRPGKSRSRAPRVARTSSFQRPGPRPQGGSWWKPSRRTEPGRSRWSSSRSTDATT